MIVNSGNDASVALAEGVGGTLPTFVEMMNRQAQAFGLKNTVFKNVTGLTEPGHRSTARDLAVIATRIIEDFPDFYPIYSTRKYRYEGAPASNENNRNVLLLRDPTVDGMKTGFTEQAGYCLIASAQRDFPEWQAAPPERGAQHHLDGGAGHRKSEVAQLGLPGLGCRAPVRGRQAAGHATGLEGQGQRGEAGCREAGVRERAQGRRPQAADQDRAHRPAGGAPSTRVSVWARSR